MSNAALVSVEQTWFWFRSGYEIVFRRIGDFRCFARTNYSIADACSLVSYLNTRPLQRGQP